MKSLWFLIASLLDGGWHLSKFDKNTMQGTFPYGVLFEEDKAAYHFRFQWVQELMFRTGKLLNIGVRGQSITYSDKVWHGHVPEKDRFCLVTGVRCEKNSNHCGLCRSPLQ